MQIISNIALISINETLLIQLISFLVFLFIINRVMFRPLQTTMGEREKYVEQLQQQVVDADREFDDVQIEIAQQEAEVREESNRVKNALLAEAGQEAEEFFSGAKEQIARERGDAEEEIRKKITEARAQIEGEARDLAEQIIEKVLDRRPA